MLALEIPLLLVAIPTAIAAGYLLLLTVLSRENAAPPLEKPRLRFEVVVPAHDEESGIAKTVHGLLALEYPREMFEILVVADNCTDATAAQAEGAGARVLARNDAERRGKGYALEYAFAASPFRDSTDAVVVIDADTLPSPNLLSAFQARIARGAQAVQADYGVQSPQASWRTRLITIALGMFHIVRSRGRERLSVSCGLRGNGMCFTRAVIQEVPHRAFSLVEDLEYGLRLGEAGHRVHYAGEAHVYGEMVSSGDAARSQRRRWEGGRLEFARRHGLRLLCKGARQRDKVLIDLALDVLVPPLSTIAGVCGAGLIASTWLSVASARASLSLFLYAGSTLALMAYVLRGWAVSGIGPRGALDLLRAPAFIAWKLALAVSRRGRTSEWVRTARERNSG